MLHFGSYNDETKSLAQIEDFITRSSLHNDIGRIKDEFFHTHH